MSITHTHVASVLTPGRNASASFAITDNQETVTDVVVAASQTDYQVDTFDVVVARLKSLFIVSDQDVTMEVNSTGGSGGSFALKANKPLAWYTGSYYACPFTVDVTSLYFTTGAIAASANIQLVALVDPTP